MTLLDVRDLSVDLGGRTVLDGVDLAIDAGEFVGLVGPNGAGKTTLLRSILGLVSIFAGEVRVGGSATRSARRTIGYVPQRLEFAWDFPVSVEEVVLPGRTRSAGWLRRPGVRDWRAVREALERVRLADLRRRPVGELSGGQRQRVLVARALALNPRLLLLDEPFTGLDIPMQELLMDLFSELSDEGAALLMTTHDLVGAVHGCSRLALINRRVVADGPPEALADDDLWRRTFGFREGSPLLTQIGAR